jgi:hypothetical protein
MPAITLQQYVVQSSEAMRKGIIQKILHDSIFMRILYFVPVNAMAYQYAEQSKLPGVAFRKIGELYTGDTGVVNPKEERLVPFGNIVSIDHSMEGSATHTNAVMAMIRAAGLYYDYNVINGDSGDGKQFDGLKKRLVNNQVIYAGDNGADISVDLVDQLLDAVAGPNSGKVLLMSKYQRRKFKKSIRAQAGGTTPVDVATPLDSYEGARIETLDEDDVEQVILPQTETRGSSNVTGSVYCIRPGQDPEGEYVQGLVKSNMVEHIPLAQVNTVVSDLIEMFGGLGVFHGRAAARLAGLL